MGIMSLFTHALTRTTKSSGDSISASLCPSGWEHLNERQVEQAVKEGDLDPQKLWDHVANERWDEAAKLIYKAKFCLDDDDENEPIDRVMVAYVPRAGGKRRLLVFVKQPKRTGWFD